MVRRQTGIKIRKVHRYLGIFLGIQFLMWTISGLYFSWSDIDEIHGDHFRKEVEPISYNNLLPMDSIAPQLSIHSLELRTVGDQPYYWVNENMLIDARTGKVKSEISEDEALNEASRNIIDDLKVVDVERITTVGKHHEYRERPLPAYVVSYEHPDKVKAYISAKDGAFQRVRYRSWRWFDFLWMTHTMDYEGRDNFNTTVLRAFSALGLITVLSGFLLWFTTSTTVRKIIKRNTDKIK